MGLPTALTCDRHRERLQSRATRRVRFALGGLSAGVVGLLLAPMPALADGGPHVRDANSGVSTLTADSCAGCHRAHTADAPMLLASADDELCLDCHGAAGAGATSNVADGVQYADGIDPQAAVAGALRSGGFVNARIDSANPTRISFPRIRRGEVIADFSSLVPARAAGAPVTSAHLDLGQPAIDARSIAWGNGPLNAASPTVSVGCTTCHNPHGNGQYRILRPVPTPATSASSTVPFVAAAAPVVVTDLALPTGGGAAGTRNYTVQWGRTLQDVLDAGDGPAAGDYWRRYLPWDGVPSWNGSSIVPATGVAGDRPEYDPDAATNLTSFRGQIRAWCSTCHTRYDAPTSGATTPSGDALYAYRHTTQQTECTQCHVAHGSNAAMSGSRSGSAPYPDGSASPSSRLLKVDSRGTCQQCHDPTRTIAYDGVVTP